jgi:hypothetical protein
MSGGLTILSPCLLKGLTPRSVSTNPESVQILLPMVRSVVDEERARGRHLDVKAGSFAAFIAVALSLEAGLAPNAYGADLLNGEAEGIFTVFFIGAIFSFLIAGILAVLGALAPQKHPGIDEEQIDAYSDRPKVTTPPDDLQMTELRTLTEVAIGDRAAYDRKARVLTFASLFVAAGILGISGQAVTIALA